MTKTEWWAGADPVEMIRFVRATASARKLRLLAVASFRRACFFSCPVDEWERMLAYGERCVERSARASAPFPTAPTHSDAVTALRMLTTENPVTAACVACEWSAERRSTLVGHVAYGRPEERLVQAEFVRDIFGNPLQPPAFRPDWRTDTAVTIARQMYESRDFSAMPILADALQDAGCDSADLLRHCREPGEHVRGCWAVDLVLGNE